VYYPLFGRAVGGGVPRELSVSQRLPRELSVKTHELEASEAEREAGGGGGSRSGGGESLKSVSIKLPEGVVAGQELQVEVGGDTVRFRVPEGAQGGQVRRESLLY
jgi:hypothetical protein